MPSSSKQSVNEVKLQCWQVQYMWKTHWPCHTAHIAIHANDLGKQLSHCKAKLPVTGDAEKVVYAFNISHFIHPLQAVEELTAPSKGTPSELAAHSILFILKLYYLNVFIVLKKHLTLDGVIK